MLAGGDGDLDEWTRFCEQSSRCWLIHFGRQFIFLFASVTRNGFSYRHKHTRTANKEPYNRIGCHWACVAYTELRMDRLSETSIAYFQKFIDRRLCVCVVYLYRLNMLCSVPTLFPNDWKLDGFGHGKVKSMISIHSCLDSIKWHNDIVAVKRRAGVDQLWCGRMVKLVNILHASLEGNQSTMYWYRQRKNCLQHQEIWN